MSERPATPAASPFDGSVVVSGDQDAVYNNLSPTLHVFDSSNNALQALPLNAQYDSVAGLAIGSGTADHLYVVLDSGFYFGERAYGFPEVQAFRQPHPTAPQLISRSASAGAGEAMLKRHH